MKKILLFAFSLLLVSCINETLEDCLGSFELDSKELILIPGDTYQFTVLRNSSPVESQFFNWYVDDTPISTEVGRISTEGLFTALRVGKAVVKVETNVGNRIMYSTCNITVIPVDATGLILNHTEVKLEVGEEETLLCFYVPENATYQDLIWETSNKDIVHIREDRENEKTAIIKGMSHGKATITVSDKLNPEIFAVCEVQVGPTRVESITLSESEKTLILGETYNLVYTILPEDATNKNVSFISSNENVAIVDINGHVTTLNVGETVITAITEDGEFKADIKLTVNPVVLTAIVFDKPVYDIQIATEQQLKISLIPFNATYKNVTWTSSNPSIASVNSEGIVQAHLKGQVRITCESEDGRVSAECIVNALTVEDMVVLNFDATTIVPVNGYCSGTLYSEIVNTSESTIRLIKFSIIDSTTGNELVAVTDEDMLGYLKENETRMLSGTIDHIYHPMVQWEVECNGVKFTKTKIFGE